MSSSAINPWPAPPPAAPAPGAVTAGRPVPARVPRVPARAKAAELIFRAGVRRMPIRVELPDGRRWGAGGPEDPVMAVARPGELFRRIGRDANIGFGEAYQAGDWSSPQLADLLTAFATQLTTAVPPSLQGLRTWAQRARARLEANTADVARRNIRAHYDLSNEMFATFLDETMTYSSAWFDPLPGAADTSGEDGVASEDGDGLTRAQLRKIDAVLDQAGVVRGSQVMEIGTGWGALSIRAAQRGATVTTLTLSVEQKRLAEERIRAARVEDRVTVLLQDYRQATGQYDAVVSVEMIEAVGAEYWPTYFATLDGLLKPGGRVALQSITMPHDRMQVSRRAYTWINKYVFPGGLIPSIEAIEATLAGHTGLRITQRRDLGLDYARTLRCWRERFLAHWPTVAAMGFDETFRRTWEYYLAYSEAGFRTGYLDVSQLQLSRSPVVRPG
jgi:cyclopropane-fatty-acyl-phospholipid synthase